MAEDENGGEPIGRRDALKRLGKMAAVAVVGASGGLAVKNFVEHGHQEGEPVSDASPMLCNDMRCKVSYLLPDIDPGLVNGVVDQYQSEIGKEPRGAEERTLEALHKGGKTFSEEDARRIIHGYKDIKRTAAIYDGVATTVAVGAGAAGALGIAYGAGGSDEPVNHARREDNRKANQDAKEKDTVTSHSTI
jgi:hypothetical protein